MCRVATARKESETVEQLTDQVLKLTVKQTSDRKLQGPVAAWARYRALPLLIVCWFNLTPPLPATIDWPQHSNVYTTNDTAIPPAFTDQQIVDIISVGSLLKVSHQDAQMRTFGSHANVRNFYRITEESDTDMECSKNLTTNNINEIIDFCGKARENESWISSRIRKQQFRPRQHPGWVCAQKRPIDGLNYVLNLYKEGLDIPKYLFITDDDTYINMDSLMSALQDNFPADAPHLVAGCTIKMYAFTFPYSGFGSFLTKKAIERLLQPINCNNTTTGEEVDPFTRLTCWRLSQDVMGEKVYFQDGMTIGDLMFRYAAEQPYSDMSQWTSGYCLHSDHALAYFMNYYHIAVPDSELNPNMKLHDGYTKHFKYVALTDEKHRERQGHCTSEGDQCTMNSTVCHYMQPDQMDLLYRQSVEERQRSII